MLTNSQRLRIFTWHIHGSYLYYLSKGNYDIYIPVNDKKDEGYYGRGKTFPFGDNVIEVDARNVWALSFDCILFQTNKNYLIDQYQVLSEEQRALPKIYLEHDPPVQHPTDTRHIIQDPDVTVVHVTHFNKLMWNNGNNDAVVIEHGVTDPGLLYTGELQKGIVVINHLQQRGRKLGADIFNKVKREVPLDLVGMGSGPPASRIRTGSNPPSSSKNSSVSSAEGLGEVLHPQLPGFISRYRFFFNPIRYTSLGLAVCEAMMAGIPMLALATTENVTVINNEVSGFIHTDVDYLIEKMKALLADPQLAMRIGKEGRRAAEKRFNINRFCREWEILFQAAINKSYLYEKQNSVY